MNPRRPEIFAYDDYQTFLKDWFAYRKASQSKFSLRWLAKEAGLASGYLPMVLNKKRSLSPTVLAKLMPFLGLTPAEQSFLENMLKFRMSDSNDVHVAAMDRMSRFQQFQRLNPKETEVYEYLTHWYYVAIREMAVLKDFRDDPKWVQKRLQYAVPLKDIREALDFLLTNGYLKKNKDGSVQPPQKPLDCRGDIFKVALAKFHREVLDLASQSIEKTASEDRSIIGQTCGLSAEGVEKAKKIVDEAIQKIRALGEDETKGEAVYHMEIALFPLAKNKRGSR